MNGLGKSVELPGMGDLGKRGDTNEFAATGQTDPNVGEDIGWDVPEIPEVDLETDWLREIPEIEEVPEDERQGVIAWAAELEEIPEIEEVSDVGDDIDDGLE